MCAHGWDEIEKWTFLHFKWKACGIFRPWPREQWTAKIRAGLWELKRQNLLAMYLCWWQKDCFQDWNFLLHIIPVKGWPRSNCTPVNYHLFIYNKPKNLIFLWYCLMFSQNLSGRTSKRPWRIDGSSTRCPAHRDHRRCCWGRHWGRNAWYPDISSTHISQNVFEVVWLFNYNKFRTFLPEFHIKHHIMNISHFTTMVSFHLKLW